MPRVGIALGSNIGDCIANLQAARDCLREIAVVGEPFLQASTYQTEPLHCPPGSPHFFNSVVEMAWEGDPFELLEITQAIESRLGRTVKPERNAPRIIDVDLLYFGGEVTDTGTLVLPHPRIGERRFVLEPLAEIRPDLILPGQALNIAERLAELLG
jgi:2-amino-4-hydroxy-6-hydroxymethyldihydropteridine diphosphokinase